MSRSALSSVTAFRKLRLAWPVLFPLAIVLLLEPAAAVVLAADGLPVVAVLLAAAGWGAWPVRRFGFDQRPPIQQFVISLVLGLFLLGIAALGLGVTGWLGAATAWGLIIAGGVAGAACLLSSQDPAARSPTLNSVPAEPPVPPAIRFAIAGLMTIPLFVMLTGATLPPGVIWPGEANGYDVLEYHLQSAREHFDAGRIAFLAHNVYAAFPQQMEIFYLLLMHLVGGSHAAAISAQLLHAAFGGLFVLALVAYAPTSRVRWCAAALAAATPWVAYLGCLAYVENALLFYAAVAAGEIVRAWRDPRRNMQAGLAGLCGGLAGATKLTALGLVAAPLGALLLADFSQPLSRRLRSTGLFVAAVLLALSPWLIRSTVQTGNPIYPFAYSWLGGRAWSQEQAEQWARGHAATDAEKGVLPRVAAAAREIFLGRVGDLPSVPGASLFGLAPVALLLGVALRWEGGATRRLALWAVLMIVVWLAATHFPGRFLVPLIIPAAVVWGEWSGAASAGARRFAPIVTLVLVAAGAAVALLSATSAYSAWQRRTGLPVLMLIGRQDVFVENHPLNSVLPPDANVRLIGDAAVFYVDRKITYHTVFNRDPWIEFGRTASPAECVAWLRREGVTHVVFNWLEIARLRRTYGFPERVSREWVDSLIAAGLVRVAPPPELASSLQSTEILSVSPGK
ncbi:MAG: hypothetical protein HZB38_10880 [Planctomycetes bacterium]|nr:hypothetical protein [Planctomycetota bacterium]